MPRWCSVLCTARHGTLSTRELLKSVLSAFGKDCRRRRQRGASRLHTGCTCNRRGAIRLTRLQPNRIFANTRVHRTSGQVQLDRCNCNRAELATAASTPVRPFMPTQAKAHWLPRLAIALPHIQHSPPLALCNARRRATQTCGRAAASARQAYHLPSSGTRSRASRAAGRRPRASPRGASSPRSQWA